MPPGNDGTANGKSFSASGPAVCRVSISDLLFANKGGVRDVISTIFPVDMTNDMIYDMSHENLGNQGDQAWSGLNSRLHPRIHADDTGNDVALESRPRPLHMRDHDWMQAHEQRRQGHARLCVHLPQTAYDRRVDGRASRWRTPVSMVVGLLPLRGRGAPLTK